MTEKAKSSLDRKEQVSAVCGLFCPACTVYIGSKEDQSRLEIIAKRVNLSVEDLKCHGCRSDKRSAHCRSCTMIACAENKGIQFCSECQEYPCDHLKGFQSAMPHRAELWESLDRMKETGIENWYDEMVTHYTCPQCATINSAYDIACRKCKKEPSCAFVQRNKLAIIPHLSKMK